jgi:hypothetical protein
MYLVQEMGGGQDIVKRIPLFGNATDIKAGAAVIRGATAGTNTGYGIIGVPTYAGFLGATEALFQASVTDNDPTAATKFILTPVVVYPKGVYSIDYDVPGLTIASMDGVTGDPTVTGLEAIDGGWLFGSDGYLSFVDTVAAGDAELRNPATVANDPPGGWIAGTTLLAKIFPRWHQLVDLTTDATLIKESTAGAGTGALCIIENYINAPGYDRILLDPTKHSGVNFGAKATLSAYATFRTVAW